MNKEELKNKLNNVYVNRDGLNTVIKDRLDFGFILDIVKFVTN